MSRPQVVEILEPFRMCVDGVRAPARTLLIGFVGYRFVRPIQVSVDGQWVRPVSPLYTGACSEADQQSALAEGWKTIELWYGEKFEAFPQEAWLEGRDASLKSHRQVVGQQREQPAIARMQQE
jgi:hypothetical protein